MSHNLHVTPKSCSHSLMPFIGLCTVGLRTSIIYHCHSLARCVQIAA